MIDTEIPPRWLGATPPELGGEAGVWRFPLPLVLRARIGREGHLFILFAAGVEGALQMRIEGKKGESLARESLPAGTPTAVFLPPGARRLVVRLSDGASGTPRLGYYPVQKVALKLHAFAHGDFSPLGLGRRWKTAGTAARTLRGALNALIATGEVESPRDVARYGKYRSRFVGDFTAKVTADAAPLLSFITAFGDLPVEGRDEALASLAHALSLQIDPAFEWVVAVPPGTRLEDVATRLGAGARLVEAPGASRAAQLAAAATAAQGGIVCPLDPTGRPTRDAVAMIRAAFAHHPDLALLYTDEERIDAHGRPLRGIFKPAFNGHLLQASGYLGHLTALPRADALRLGFREEAGEAVLFDLWLRHTAELDPRRIRHIPRVAYSAPGRRRPGFPPQESPAAAAVLARHLGVTVETSVDGRHLRPRFPLPEPAPLVSIVVPTRDRADLLGMALRTLIAETSYRAFEIIIVDNGSVEPETFALFEEIAAAWPATRIVRDDGDFNFPRICNNGVAVASGALILLLNNDIEVVDGDWLAEMVSLAALPRTGIVGAKLLYPDRTVQHAGVIAGLFRYAGHWFAHSAADAPGEEDRLLVRQNLSAVTGACLLIRKTVWDDIGPLDAVRFAEDCNDIDLCLRARRAGHEVVFTPHTGLIHHESVSRGKKRSKAHRARLKAQHARMRDAWHTDRMVDPHYNPNLDRKSLFAALAHRPEGPRDPRTDAV